MPRIYLVRHGRAAAGFGEHADPGLDDLGRHQAEATAARLAPLGPLALRSSPLARAQETAAPLAALWQRPVLIEARLAEIPSNTLELGARAEWLRGLMTDRWPNLPAPLRAWANNIATCLLEQREDTVIFSHFIAINVAAGIAAGDDRVITFHPDNASVTIVDVEHGQLRLVSRGDEANTKVN